MQVAVPFLALAVLLGQHVAADDAQFRKLNGAAVVFVAEVAQVRAGPVGLSNPPVRSYLITFDKIEPPLRGAKPRQAVLGYQVRSPQEPEFPIGKRHLVAAKAPASDGKPGPITLILPATDETLQLASQAVGLPMGWTLKEGRPLSPWAARGKAWPPEAKLTADAACSQSGRPALLAGAGIKLSVEQVPPLELQKFKNPYGDGQFKITVTNTTDAPLRVPALVQDGGAVRWSESIVLLVKDRPHVLPRRQPLQDPQPVTLEPGQSVSGAIDTLLLGDAVAWPRGGSRVHFTFCLGEAAADNFFYYYSKLHDGLRKQRLSELAQ